MKDEPPSPPIVHVGTEIIAYLLAWERHDRDGSWWAWVTWIRTQRERPFRHVVSVSADQVRPAEPAGAYRHVPRRVLGLDGRIRPWPPSHRDG